MGRAREKKISKEQAGFRKGYSTVDHIFTLTSVITKKLNSKRGGKVYVAFVDYKKAFDTVNREALWDVLQKLKTSSKMIRILKAMYNSVKSCVRWGANLSQFFECPQRVKQGCLLSPLIFSLLISEVAEYVRKNGKHGIQLLPSLEEIFLLLFADDIVFESPKSLDKFPIIILMMKMMRMMMMMMMMMMMIKNCTQPTTISMTLLAVVYGSGIHGVFVSKQTQSYSAGN